MHQRVYFLLRWKVITANFQAFMNPTHYSWFIRITILLIVRFIFRPMFVSQDAVLASTAVFCPSQFLHCFVFDTSCLYIQCLVYFICFSMLCRILFDFTFKSGISRILGITHLWDDLSNKSLWSITPTRVIAVIDYSHFLDPLSGRLHTFFIESCGYHGLRLRFWSWW